MQKQLINKLLTYLYKTRYRPMGGDDSWSATVPCVVVTGDCSHWSIHYLHQVNRPISVWMCEVPCPAGNTQNGGTILPITKPDGRCWIGKAKFLFTFHSNHTSISLSFRYSRVTDRQTHRHGRTTWTISIAGPHIVAGQLVRLTMPFTPSSQKTEMASSTSPRVHTGKT